MFEILGFAVTVSAGIVLICGGLGIWLFTRAWGGFLRRSEKVIIMVCVLAGVGTLYYAYRNSPIAVVRIPSAAAR